MSFPVKTLLSTSLLLLLTGAGLCAHAADVDADLIREEVQAHVLSRLLPHLSKTSGDKGSDKIQVEVLNVPGAPFALPDGQTLSDVSIKTTSQLDTIYSNRSIVRVSIGLSNGQTLREFGVPVKIDIKKPVWVVKNRIPAGQPLLASDLKLEEQEVSRSFAHVVGRETNLQPYVARVNLQPGETLDNRKLTIPPDVKQFTDIRIILTNGNGMQVTIPGTALSSGRIGQTIQVRQQQRNRKTFTGEIIDKNRVLVHI